MEKLPKGEESAKELQLTLRNWAGAIKYIIFLAYIGLIIPAVYYDYHTKNMIIHADKRGSCGEALFAYQESPKMVYTAPAGNYTTLISQTDYTTLKLIQPLSTINSGQAVWVSAQNELWIPDIGNNLIYVYEILTWRQLAAIDTSVYNCTSPTWSDYHPLAGPVSEGQVWISCASTTQPGWIIFHPPTRQFVAFIPMPLLLSNFLPYQIAVGAEYTVLSLQQITLATTYSLIQYDNHALTLNILTSTYGTNCALSYTKTPDSALYVSANSTSKAYKVNFTDLTLMAEWTVSQPVDLTTDWSGQYLYVLNASSILSAFSTAAPAYSAIANYPIAMPYSGAQEIQISNDNNVFYTAYSGLATATAQTINPITLMLSPDPILVPVANSSRFITNIAITCPCVLCQ